MIKKTGRLIVFEGVDAAGKTTLSDELVSFLRSEDRVVRNSHFPGKRERTLGELVYRIHHRHNSEFGVTTIHPCSLQLLHIAAHVDAIESEIKPALLDGEWIVLDRFWWSTYVYGLDNGVQESQLRHMINVEIDAWGPIKPDIIFLVDSEIPLREDETNSIAWHRKRKIYRRIAVEDQSQKCVHLITGKEDHLKQQALSVIRAAVAALYR